MILLSCRLTTCASRPLGLVRFRNAWAICGLAHLKNLKAFNKKVLDLCSMNLEYDASLRPANMNEVIAADRKIWSTISDLVEGGEKSSASGPLADATPTKQSKGEGKTHKNAPAAGVPSDWPKDWLSEVRGKPVASAQSTAC